MTTHINGFCQISPYLWLGSARNILSPSSYFIFFSNSFLPIFVVLSYFSLFRIFRFSVFFVNDHPHKWVLPDKSLSVIGQCKKYTKPIGNSYFLFFSYFSIFRIFRFFVFFDFSYFSIFRIFHIFRIFIFTINDHTYKWILPDKYLSVIGQCKKYTKPIGTSYLQQFDGTISRLTHFSNFHFQIFKFSFLNFHFQILIFKFSISNFYFYYKWPHI